nr:MAG TPA: hypothetical protein [Caudoviricetes sp.]
MSRFIQAALCHHRVQTISPPPFKGRVPFRLAI